ncbi:MAG: thiamine phosphate synthase [Planctomycetes bacterium]|nr:thiamine phosphate synthase [Planctomycetota bacterium]
MELELSSACKRALDFAFDLAFEEGKLEPDAKHCISALLNDPEGPVANLLKDFGLKETSLVSEKITTNVNARSSVLEFAKKPYISNKIFRISKKVLAEQEGTSLGFLVYLVEDFHNTQIILEGLGVQWEKLLSWIDKQRMAPLVLDVPLNLNASTEIDSCLRIMDAAGNRVREGLRVVDDYCRFILNSPDLCSTTKKLRHDFNEALRWIPASLLISQRNVDEDVGTIIHTNQELTRLNDQDVFKANIKRVQESLRSLEEFGKLESADFSVAIGEIRYRSYDLEQKIFRFLNLSEKLNSIKIYGLLGTEHLTPTFMDTLDSLLENGLDMVQLRIKNIPDNKLLEHAFELKTLVAQNGKILIINDRPDIAKIVDADGVHLGQDDLPLKEAKSIIGRNKIIGISTHNTEQIHMAIDNGCDYIGVGPVFNSKTKTFSKLAGLEFVKTSNAICTIPWFAIGGIDHLNISQLTKLGVKRIAVSNSLFNSENPLKTLKALKHALGND